MRAAFAIWNDRIAPVFDVARQVHFVEAESGHIIHEGKEKLPQDPPAGKAIRLSELNVEVLVCGAISRPLQVMVEAYGIRVIPFVTGDLNEIVLALLSGTIGNELFAMPGCWRTGRQRLQGVCRLEKYEQINGINRGNTGSGDGQGQDRSGRRTGRMGGTGSIGAAGTCVCPQCGQKEPHERGVPCFERICSKCGTAMTRE